MSTHSYIPGLRRRSGLSALSLLCGLLFALQLILPSAAFATASAHTNTPAFNAQGVLDLAGVSVVRLVAEYTGTTNHTTLNCTGLGTVVGSWSPTSPGEKNNWILTDSTLINPNGQTCVPRMNGQLTKITMYANNAYTNTTFNLAQLGTPLQCQPVQGKAVCRDTALETLTQPLSGAVLFSFHTDSSHLQPFLPVVAQQGAGLQLGIELENPNATPGWPTSPVLGGANPQPELLLTPKTVNAPAGSQSATGTGTPVQGGLQPSASGEPGMPIVNSDGNIVGMTLTGGSQLPGQTIQSLLNQQPELQRPPQGSRVNTLNSTWDQGITQYERGEYSAAQATLKEIDRANPQFQAALFFELKAVAQPSQGTNGTPAATNGSGSQPAKATAGVSSILLLIGLVGGLLILILLLILVSMWARRRQELARFEAERIEAQRSADREALQIQRSKATVNLQHPSTELPCPNCGTIVHTTAAFCPHCRFLLSPSESGLHLRATPPPSIAPQPQANYMQPPVAPASSISDLPTVEFSPSNGSMNSEATLPYNIQQLQGRNLSLAVGHLTDPGIKRKHKPNEDSLFAMQGSRTYNSLPQEFGLFVVADGMGGHANGQHASRLAIQTIIDYMLPKISMKNQMDEEALLNLLCEGVQRANQAVHQRNLEERADMGTTMTAALVVGANAYVANVGDSRTYLYREPEGLTKITHDHSVVASLVEAGIIKPDDIYTHPKRNQIYRSLGEKLNVDVDSFKVPLQPGDKLLLCSDGLWDMVRDPEIQRLMSLPTPDPAKIGKDLIQAALNGGGEDNVSVIVVSFSEAPDTNQAGMTGVQLLAKPETVTVPDLPLM